jgi:hypothetical protein
MSKQTGRMVYVYKPRTDGEPGARELFYTQYSRRPSALRTCSPLYLHAKALIHELPRVDWTADYALVYWGKVR